MVESVVDGSKITKVFDPTQRVIDIDPDVEAIVRGPNREVPGEVIERDITWTGPAGNKHFAKKLKIPVRSTAQDLVYGLCLAMKKQELGANFVEITPEDWNTRRVIAVTFQYERADLPSLKKVTPVAFRSRFDPRFPVFVERDGACGGNHEKRSRGGWGAALVHCGMSCKRCGAKAGTSNNEMECQAMLSAMELIPPGSYVCMETDSQACIDGLTTYRKRWEKCGWRREDGKEVENPDIIIPLAKEIDQRNVGFGKVKWHTGDPWNDLADSLAVNGRNQQSREVVVQLVFRAGINKKEQFVGFDRFSIQALANIHDFWPRHVARCGDVIWAPEDYEI
jgi:ribonuclease HI